MVCPLFYATRENKSFRTMTVTSISIVWDSEKMNDMRDFERFKSDKAQKR